jgi:hypothetical protein
MDEFVELRDEGGLAVRPDQDAGATGRADLHPAVPDEADAAPSREVQARIRAALLEERGILEALRGA